MNLANQIARILFDAGVRLDDADDTGAITRPLDCAKWHQIEQTVFASGVELTVHTDEIQSRGFGVACCFAARDYADKLTDDIDGALWALQQAMEKAA